MPIKTLEAATDLIRFNDVASAVGYVDETEAFFRQRFSVLRRGLKNPVLARMFVASYSHPNPKSNKHLDILYELFDKVNVLESIYATLVSQFGTMAKAQSLITRVQVLIATSKRKVNAALIALSKAVERHQPDYFRQCHESLAAMIARHKASYQNVEPLCLSRVIVDKEGNTVGSQFCVYFQFTGLQDSSGFRHDRYHIALSCIVDKFGRYSMNYCLQPTLLLPGKFKSNNFFSSSKDAYEGILQNMQEEGFDWRAT